MYKKLVSPEFRLNTEQYELAGGMEIECVSSREARSDWCRIELTSQLKNRIEYEDMERAVLEMGYGDDFDTLIFGYCRKTAEDYWKEITIRDDMIRVGRVMIRDTFVDCTPQDIIKYILTQAGITKYRLPDEDYGKKGTVITDRQTGIKAIAQVNSVWGLNHDFFFRDGVFYWGCQPEQEAVYILEENTNILSLQKPGTLYEIETLGIPWIHHSQEIEVHHSKYDGTVKVEKTIMKCDSDGFVRMYIYFKGEK